MGQIVDARIAGKSISELTDKELKVEADKAIFKISAICGAQLPQVDVFAEILTEEFLKFLIGFGYKDYTFEEIMLAFRLNASSSMRYSSGIEAERIEYSGAHFNVDYAAKILFNYSKFRDLTDRKFQNFIDGHE